VVFQTTGCRFESDLLHSQRGEVVYLVVLISRRPPVRIWPLQLQAEVAQLIERILAKDQAASLNLVFCSERWSNYKGLSK
jgi:hypothetical protein